MGDRPPPSPHAAIDFSARVNEKLPVTTLATGSFDVREVAIRRRDPPSRRRSPIALSPHHVHFTSSDASSTAPIRADVSA